MAKPYPTPPGTRFNLLTVLGEAERSATGRRRLSCLCDCGTTKTVALGDILSGHTGSCGCEQRRLSSERRLRHGGTVPGTTNPKLFKVWAGMLARTTNPNAEKFKHYGRRGIAVCQEWAADFGAFRRWAEASGYEDGLTIDRIDNDSGYSPDNCRWATKAEQNRNYRRNRMHTIDGVTKCLKDWAADYGLKPSTVYWRADQGKDPSEWFRPVPA